MHSRCPVRLSLAVFPSFFNCVCDDYFIYLPFYFFKPYELLQFFVIGFCIIVPVEQKNVRRILQVCIKDIFAEAPGSEGFKSLKYLCLGKFITLILFEKLRCLIRIL